MYAQMQYDLRPNYAAWACRIGSVPKLWISPEFIRLQIHNLIITFTEMLDLLEYLFAQAPSLSTIISIQLFLN